MSGPPVGSKESASLPTFPTSKPKKREKYETPSDSGLTQSKKRISWKKKIKSRLPFRKKLQDTLEEISNKPGAQRSNWDDLGSPRGVPDSQLPNMNDEQLNEKLIRKLNKRVGLPISSEGTEQILKNYTKEEKVSILQEFETGKAAKSRFAESSYYIDVLQHPEKLTQSIVGNLAVQLKFCSLEYILEFFHEKGIECLVQALRYMEFQCSSLWNHHRLVEQKSRVKIVEKETTNENGMAPFPGVRLTTIPAELDSESKFKEAVEIMCGLLNSIIGAMHHPVKQIPEAFFSIPDVVPLSIRILEWCPTRLQGDVFLLIAGGVVLRIKERKRVLSILNSVPLYEQTFFKNHIFDELRLGYNVQYKISYLTLVNTIISLHRPEARLEICKKFVSKVLLDAFQNFSLVYPDDALCFQLDLVREVLSGNVPHFEEEHTYASNFEFLEQAARALGKSGPDSNSNSPSASSSISGADVSEALQQQQQQQQSEPAPICAAPPPPPPPPPPPGGSGGPPPPPPPPGAPGAPPPPPPPPMNKPVNRTIPFPLTKLRADVLEKSMYKGIGSAEALEKKIDKELLLKHFLKTPMAPKGPIKTKTRPENTSSVNILAERGTTGVFAIEVVLRGLQQNREPISTSDIIKCLQTGKVSPMTEQDVDNILSLFPVDAMKRLKYPKEEEEFKKLPADKLSSLTRPEKFLYDLYALNAPRDRLLLLKYKSSLPELLPLIREQQEVVLRAMKSFETNSELRDFLQIVVATSNFLTNPGVPNTSMDMLSLNKLKTIKTNDKKKTLLHVLILMVQKHHRHILQFPKKLTSLRESISACAIISDYSATVSSQLRNAAEISERLDLQNNKRFFSRREKEFEDIKAATNAIVDKMEYLGYQQSRTDLSGFFEFWTDFVDTFNLSLQWLEDTQQVEKKEQQREARRMRDKLIVDVYKGSSASKKNLKTLLSSDAPEFDAGMNTGITVLRESPEFHKSLRHSTHIKTKKKGIRRRSKLK